MAEGGAGGPSDPRGTGTIPRQGEPPSSQAEHQHRGAHGVTTSDNQQAGQMPPLIILEPTSDRQGSNLESRLLDVAYGEDKTKP